MKILHLNTFETGGGAATAASRLRQGLRETGVDAEILVQYPDTPPGPGTIAPETFMGKMAVDLSRHLDALPARFYTKRPVTRFTPAMVPDRLHHRVMAREPDLVHLHWVGAGFFRLESLARLKRPLVWTLHDSWTFTGGCHLPFDCLRYQTRCGACPVLGSARENDLSRWVWERKKRAWKNIDLTLVAPSRWLADCARSSPLFGDSRIEVIPNGLDLNQFLPAEKETARETLCLPREKRLILFGAVNSTSDANKGFHFLQAALQRLVAEGWGGQTELVVFGASQPENPPDLGMRVHYFGYVKDERRLSLLYSAADLFVAPSIQENLSTTVMESLACGTPVVAFAVGGMPDLIEHGSNGFLAPPFETNDLAAGMVSILSAEADRSEDLSRQARQKAEKEFSLSKFVRSYANIYQELLDAADRRGQGH